MSFFRNKWKKSKYQILSVDQDERHKLEHGEVVVGEGFSRDSVSYLINNFVNPTKDSNCLDRRRFSLKEFQPCDSWSVLSTVSLPNRNSKREEGDHRTCKSLSALTERNYNTFLRLKKKLNNLKNFYPDIYYNKDSVIEMWARHDELKEINFDILEYDRSVLERIFLFPVQNLHLPRQRQHYRNRNVG